MADVKIDLGRLKGLAADKAEDGIRTAALQGEAILKADLLSRPGTGVLYGRHRASAPGQTPAPDTGRLRASTQADLQVRRDGDDLVGRVVANTEYARALEVGTERMVARPYLSRLVSEFGGQLVRAFRAGASR
jgi:hypothetical protein